MGTTNSATLLIVDDTIANIKVLSSFLREEGYNVLIAEEGQQGLDIAAQLQPDLILLDIMMPGIDGIQVCRHLKAAACTAQIPVIFITALDSIDDKVQAFESGGADFIIKPFQQQEVSVRIATHLTLAAQRHELQARTAELEKRNQELDSFAHMVAHDLKNPLGTIASINSVILERCENAQMPTLKWLERAARNVEQSSRQGLSVIDALLKLAGVTRQTALHISPLNMDFIVNGVLQKLEMSIRHTDAQIEQPDYWLPAMGYFPWVEEVWLNYLSNALKYGGSPPRLQLGTDVLPATAEQLSAHVATAPQIRFWVKDNGVGLSVEEQAKLFTPFTRLHKEKAEGHGLGLSIVQQIIEKLGGTVGVESVEGEGCLFYFTLPAIRED